MGLRAWLAPPSGGLVQRNPNPARGLYGSRKRQLPQLILETGPSLLRKGSFANHHILFATSPESDPSGVYHQVIGPDVIDSMNLAQNTAHLDLVVPYLDSRLR